MSERYKIGLARNRLFAFENTVVFIGKLLGDFIESDCDRVMRMLAMREPLLTGVVQLEGDTAYVVTQQVVPEIVYTSESSDVIRERLSTEGIDFNKGLFCFYVCEGNTLVIGGHTVVCDCKSLLRLAKDFAMCYERKSISVEMRDVITFPDTLSMPGNINSPLTDKLSAELDAKWKNKDIKISSDDYKKSRDKYFDSFCGVGRISRVINNAETEALISQCNEAGIDMSSLVAFGFYEAMNELVSVPKKARRISVNGDRRFFVDGADNCNIGAFNGLVDVSLKPKDDKKTSRERIKAFHLAHYKGVTSPFKAFYDELLLMKVEPACCDASYMCMAGVYSSKAAERLALNYGCANKRLCEFFSCNIRQSYWSELSFFESVFVAEPFKYRFGGQVSFLNTHKGGVIEFCYNRSDITDSVGENIVKRAMDFIQKS